MNFSMPGLPVFHNLLEFAKLMSIKWVMPSIQPSHPLSLPSSVLNLSQHQDLFQMNQLFASGGQSIGGSASILPMNIQDWFPLVLTDLISLPSKGLSRVFFSPTTWKHQFFSTQPSLWSNCHIHMWDETCSLGAWREAAKSNGKNTGLEFEAYSLVYSLGHQPRPLWASTPLPLKKAGENTGVRWVSHGQRQEKGLVRLRCILSCLIHALPSLAPLSRVPSSTVRLQLWVTPEDRESCSRWLSLTSVSLPWDLSEGPAVRLWLPRFPGKRAEWGRDWLEAMIWISWYQGQDSAEC